MDTYLLLQMLKVDLGMRTTTPDQDEYLTQRIAAAIDELRGFGVSLRGESAADRDVVVMYAAWLYRNRTTTTRSGATDQMPAMVRAAINNHKVRSAT